MSEVSGPFQKTTYSPRILPILHVTFNVIKPNGTSFRDDVDFYVDSGFDGDLKMSQSLGSRLQGMGIQGIDRYPTVADRKTKAKSFQGQILKIELNNLDIPIPNPIDCTIICMGNDSQPRLIGLNALQRWKVCLDIPQGMLTVS